MILMLPDSNRLNRISGRVINPFFVLLKDMHRKFPTAEVWSGLQDWLCHSFTCVD